MLPGEHTGGGIQGALRMTAKSLGGRGEGILGGQITMCKTIEA